MSERPVLRFVVLVAIGLCTAPLSALAAPPDHKGKSAESAHLVQPNVDYDAVRRVVVAGHYTGYKSLPPGIAKNLARGKPLPPGIAKKAVPATVLQQLPAYPDYEWTRCGTDLVLIEVATRVVADVLTGIFK